LGRGILRTNADSSQDLAGPFNQFNLNTPKFAWFPGLSISYAKSGNVRMLSIALSWGAGASVSGCPTSTTTL
jgi:hypothetical protein